MTTSTTPTTPTPNILSDEQIKSFWEDGFLVLDLKLFSDSKIAEAKSQARKIVKSFLEAKGDSFSSSFSTEGEKSHTRDETFLLSGDKIVPFFEEITIPEDSDLPFDHEFKKISKIPINKIGHNLHQLDSFFSSITHLSVYRQISLQLGYIDPRVVQSMYIFKGARYGGSVAPHKDESFLISSRNNENNTMDIPSTPKLKHQDTSTCMAFWVPFCDVDEGNSCLYVIPGSKLKGGPTPTDRLFIRTPLGKIIFNKAKTTNPETSSSSDNPETENDDPALTKFIYPRGKDAFSPPPTSGSDNLFIPVIVKAGQIVIFNGRLWHYSKKNESDRNRDAYVFHVCDGIHPWHSDNWLQRSDGSSFPKL